MQNYKTFTRLYRKIYKFFDFRIEKVFLNKMQKQTINHKRKD